MKRITFGERVIASAGYDALRAVMELEFTQTGNVSRFHNVSEEIWYGLKRADFPDRFFQKYIRGRYEECRISYSPLIRQSGEGRGARQERSSAGTVSYERGESRQSAGKRESAALEAPRRQV